MIQILAKASGLIYASASTCALITVAYRDSEAVSTSQRLSWILVSLWYLRPWCSTDAENKRAVQNVHCAKKRALSSLNLAAVLLLWQFSLVVWMNPAAVRSRNNLPVTFWLYAHYGAAVVFTTKQPVWGVISATTQEEEELRGNGATSCCQQEWDSIFFSRMITVECYATFRIRQMSLMITAC